MKKQIEKTAKNLLKISLEACVAYLAIHGLDMADLATLIVKGN